MKKCDVGFSINEKFFPREEKDRYSVDTEGGIDYDRYERKQKLINKTPWKIDDYVRIIDSSRYDYGKVRRITQVAYIKGQSYGSEWRDAHWRCCLDFDGMDYCFDQYQVSKPIPGYKEALEYLKRIGYLK